MSFLSAQKGLDSDHPGFMEAIAKEEKKIVHRQDNIKALVFDHQKFLAGDTKEVEDHDRIYERWLHDYCNAQHPPQSLPLANRA